MRARAWLPYVCVVAVVVVFAFLIASLATRTPGERQERFQDRIDKQVGQIEEVRIGDTVCLAHRGYIEYASCHGATS